MKKVLLKKPQPVRRDDKHLNRVTRLMNSIWRKRKLTVLLLALAIAAYRIATILSSDHDALTATFEITASIAIAVFVSLFLHGLVEYFVRD